MLKIARNRKRYARVDRRPLDPPPVVHLKMFEVHDAGTAREIEKELSYELSAQCFQDGLCIKREQADARLFVPFTAMSKCSGCFARWICFRYLGRSQ